MGDPMAARDLQLQLQAELDPEFHIVRLLGEGSVAQVYLTRPWAGPTSSTSLKYIVAGDARFTTITVAVTPM